MAECPFCGGEVSEDLITFGGPCPKCFAHIPGEEAATDPGEEVKAAQEASDRRRSGLRAMIPIALATPVVLCIGATAVWFAFFKPEPQVAMLDFDELESYFMPEIVAAAEVQPEPEQPKQVATAKRSTEKRPRFSGTPDVTPDDGLSAADLAGADPARVARHEETTRRARGAAADLGPASLGTDLADGGSQQSGLNFGLDARVNRRAAVLENPDDIRDMIAAKMSAQLPQLNQCYERQLKVDPTLEGRWRIRYTVTKDGRVDAPIIEGLTTRNQDLEDCMAQQMVRWTFDRIAYNQPVQRTVALRPR